MIQTDALIKDYVPMHLINDTHQGVHYNIRIGALNRICALESGL